MIRFNLPFMPDPDYAAHIASLGDMVHCVHFPLDRPDALSARPRTGPGEQGGLVRLLAALPGVKKYALINARFHDPQLYADPAQLKDLASTLASMADHGVLDGIVFADAYHLTALGHAAPETAERLEAVPSVNCMIDSPGKAFALLDLVRECGFREPGKLSLDRSLNRNPCRLRETVAAVRARYPRMRMELLANEGCLPHCPHKPAHDAVSAHLELTGAAACQTMFELNRDAGCVRRLARRPELALGSPFIRPEDADSLADACDLLKLCGRTRGPAFLRMVSTAYARKSHDGNLFDLLDAMEWMGSLFHLPNRELPRDFHQVLSECHGQCAECGYCARLFERLARRVPLLARKREAEGG